MRLRTLRLIFAWRSNLADIDWVVELDVRVLLNIMEDWSCYRWLSLPSTIRWLLLVCREEEDLGKIKGEFNALGESIYVHVVGNDSNTCSNVFRWESLLELLERICNHVDLHCYAALSVMNDLSCVK